MDSTSIPHGLGYAVGTLAALESLRSPGGLGRFLTERARAVGDPSTRAGLQGSPFTAGFLGVGGSGQPISAAGEPERAGLTPEQAAQMGVQITGPSPTFGGAPPPSGSRFVPNLPPLDPEAELQQQMARSVLGLLQQPGMAEQAGRHAIGLQPPGLTAQQIAASRETLAPGETLQVPLAGGAKETLRGRFGAGGAVPYGYIRDDVSGRLVRDPRVPAAKAGGAEGGPKSEFQLYLSDPEKWRELQEKKAAAAASAAGKKREAQPLPPKLQGEVTDTRETIRMMDELLDIAQSPEGRAKIGFVVGHYQSGKYGVGLENDPVAVAINTLAQRVSLLGGASIMRIAGTRAIQALNQMQQHFSKPWDNPVEFLTKLAENRKSLLNLAVEGVTIAEQNPATVLDELKSLEAPGYKGRLGPQGQSPDLQRTPGGNSYRVLGE